MEHINLNAPSLSALDVESGLSMLKTMDRPEDGELRILFFTATFFVLDGVTLTIRRLQSYLQQKGASYKVLTTVPDNIDPLDEQMKDIIPVPGIKISFTNAGEGYQAGISLDDNTIREIEKYKPNVVHFTVPDFVALDGIRWCQKNNIAYIATWHSNYVEYLKYYFLEWILGGAFKRYLKGFYEQVPIIYIPTPYMLKKMEKWGYGVSTQLKEWGRGIDLKMFNPERRSKAFRESKGITDDDIVILWVGRLVPEKRPDIWLNVLRRLQQEGHQVKGMVVGHGTFENSLAGNKNIVCCGWLSGVGLAEAYASSDVLVFPSDVETFGNVTLEALACGCPCVVEKNCGGHLVEDGINGYACEAGNTDAFYEGTRKLVTDAQHRKLQGKNAREGAWKYERTKIMQMMVDNYKDAVIRHRDVNYCKQYIQSSPEAAGNNLLSYLCCNYWLIKTIAEPFMISTQTAMDLSDSAQLCVSKSKQRLQCNSSTDLEDLEAQGASSSRYEDERKGRALYPLAVSRETAALIQSSIYYTTTSFSYLVVLTLIYYSFFAQV